MRKALPTTFVVLILLLTIVLPSCNEDDPTDIGQDIFAGTANPGTSFTDTQAITATLVRSEPVEHGAVTTFGVYRPFLLGAISEDPVFGSSFAGIYASMAPTTEVNHISANLRFDSLHLYLDYEDVAAYGDTTSLQNIVVYEMTESIDSTDFFSDRDFAIHEPELVRKSDFKFEPLTDFVLGDDTLNSRLFFDLSEAMRDGELLGEKFTDVLRDPLDSTFYENDSFQEFFRGFYIAPDTTLSNNAIVNIDMRSSSSAMILYFSNLDETVVENQSRLRSFGVLNNNHIVNRYEHNYGAAIDQSIQTVLASPTRELTDKAYLHGYAGLQMDLEFPELAALGNILVNKAELVFTHVHDDDNEDANFAPPTSFDYTALNEDGNFDFIEDYNISPTVEIEIDEEAEPTTTTYTFNINQHLQNLVNGELPDNKLRISISSVSAFSDESIRNRVLLSGPENLDDDLRMKLNLFYTDIP